MGAKIVAVVMAGVGVVALVDVLNKPQGTKAAFDGLTGLTKTAGNTLLGQTQPG